MRFDEDKNSWLKYSLKDIATLLKGNGISKSDLSETGKPCILYGQLYTTYKNEVIREVFSKTNVALNSSINSLVNDVIIPGSGETSEDIATACCVLENNVLYGGDLNIIRLNKGYDGRFLSYQLNGKRKFDIARIAQGKSIVHLHNDDLQNLEIFYPDDSRIAIKIVYLLEKIDSRIEAQSKIINNIESLISGIRYQIFARKNHKFASSDVRQLGDFLEEYSKKNVNNNLISVAIGKYGIRKRDEIYSKELSADYSKNKVIEKDTLCIGMGSSQIDIGILTEDIQYCVSPAYTTYRITGIISSYLNEYLIYLNKLLSKRYMIIGARQGKSVNKKELLMHEIEIHSTDEQLEIVKIFSVLNAKLEKEKDILELYKKQKVYLLQNLFI